MRKYQPIWEQLKQKGFCKVAVPKPLQRRVIKGVIKEKDEDIVFKFLSAEDGKWYKLSYVIHGAEITFSIHTPTSTINLKDI